MRFISRRLYLKGILAAICFSLASVCAVDAAEEIPILSGRVKITATQQGAPDDFCFELTVEHGGERFMVSTCPFPSRDRRDAIAKLQTSIGWKGGYLFVGEECGGGNMRRCNRDHVFALRQGRLLYIGETHGWAETPGSYEDSYFMDVYDKFEYNRLTSHAGAPYIRLLMQEKGGRFHVDLQRTWQANRREFEANTTVIHALLAKVPKNPSGLSEDVASPLLFNAVLAKYCNRHKEFKQTMHLAKTAMGGEVQRLLQIIADVVPGELPEELGEVRPLHTDMRTK